MAEKQAKPLGIMSELFDWAEIAVEVIVIIILIFTFLIRNTGIEGDSMMQTLHEGDTVFMSNFMYEPAQNDVVVVTKKSFMAEPIVKRVIATEGQTVTFDPATSVVYVDGVAQDETYINERTFSWSSSPLTQVVPENHIFIMGDNRNHSTDSRSSMVSFVDKRLVLGHVLFRLFPLDKIGSIV